MDDKFNYIDSKMKFLSSQNLIRRQNIFSSTQSAISKINGKELLLFSSSNYLSIIENENIFDKGVNLAKKFGMGSGGSRLTTGSSILHTELEDKLAKFCGYESALVFNSGYTANVGVISSIATEEHIIFSDEKNHASLIDGCRLSKSKIVIYEHNNLKDLENKLKLYYKFNKIIVSDSVFSMDGDIIDLKGIINLGNKYNAITIIDDAHGFGVLGENGRGIIELTEEKLKPDILIATLSKAIGVEGGFVGTFKKVREYILNHARSYIFSTSMSHLAIACNIASLDFISESNENLIRLKENVQYIKLRLKDIGIEVDGRVPIIKVLIGDEGKAIRISESLYEDGIYVPAIRFPTVEKNKAILRITLMSSHTKDQINFLVDRLRFYINEE
ncbi:MAG: aminotransferase class I/II-fold pyridoxal phosphate-dependent enzyme [Peptoniphilus sp.]|uniref:aminotransferase class I/II-fold pyridoxal phosphate-dependent enzyme n=1 Tax=Peptoniphilus sp. TaxID=1971214 RepID=UPI002A762B56|nr:aminotransferase class I/II-fold pyridoxal phosphate-dependent enzyme [Peptoniphilus sp.]MDY2987616.1 aminotransferase class I/II-fold pyridoxal phosphate-dependent enzyme [Peptoniphilus sp.]